MKKEFSQFLDLSRWVAAFMVVIAHVRHLVLVDYGQVVDANVLVKGLYFVTGLGHEAVVLFFVISGFLVGGLSLKKWRARGMNVADYFAHRISRIYTVLIPALLVGWGLDYYGYAHFNETGLYTEGMKFSTNSLKDSIVGDLGFMTFLGNVLMLEGERIPLLGSNGPLWSLAYEWWYYCLFVAGAGLVLLRGGKAWVSGAVMLAIVIVAPLHMLLWGMIWLFGVAAFLYCESAWRKPPVWLPLLLFFGGLALSRANTHSNVVDVSSSLFMTLLLSFTYDALIGVGYALLLVALYDKERGWIPLPGLHKRLADFSYSMYLVHFPLLVLLVAGLHDRFGVRFLVQPDAWGLAYYAAVIAALMGYSFVFSRLTEVHTPRVKAWLVKVLRA
jgi:peptidoglycan/LPS O-acetylase OafA/YrhL